MNSWKHAVALMQKRPINCLKVIGLQFVIWLFNLIPFIFENQPIFMLITLMPIAIITAILLYGGYYLLFMNDESVSISEMSNHLIQAFKSKWGRLLKYFLIMVLFAFGFFILFIFVIIFAIGDSMMISQTEIIDVMDAFTTFTTFSVLVMVASFLLLLGDYFFEYVIIGVYFGHATALSSAFGQWKNILILTFLVTVLNMIPLVGALIFAALNIIIPLKMLLDIKEVNLLHSEN